MNNVLVEKVNEIETDFGDKFGGLPPNWCRNCHTLGAAFPKDYKCGNCNYNGIGHFKEYLHSSFIALLEADVERLKKRAYELWGKEEPELRMEVEREITYKQQAIDELKQII